MPKKRKVKKGFVMLLSMPVVYIIIISMSVFIDQTITIINKKQEKDLLLAEKERLLKEERYLKSEVIKFHDPDYIARYAREKYLFSKDGEFIFKR